MVYVKNYVIFVDKENELEVFFVPNYGSMLPFNLNISFSGGQ